jgi:hypothetical protein
MSEEDRKPKPKAKADEIDPTTFDAAAVSQQAREIVEVIGADAVLIVWTKQRRRKTSVSMTSLGNALTVAGLMQWIAAKVEEAESEVEVQREGAVTVVGPESLCVA